MMSSVTSWPERLNDYLASHNYLGLTHLPEIISPSGFGHFMLLSLVVGIPLWGLIKRIEVFNVFVQGSKQGIDVVVQIIPFLVGMVVAVGMLSASGAFNPESPYSLIAVFKPIFGIFKLPVDIVSMAIVRPFSGSASLAMLEDMVQNYGADSVVARVSATIMGSTETTFYLVAMYLGAVGIKRVRYSVAAGLIADMVGVVAAYYICIHLLSSFFIEHNHEAKHDNITPGREVVLGKRGNTQHPETLDSREGSDDMSMITQSTLNLLQDNQY